MYNYKKADFKNFQEVLSHVSWDYICFDSDIESAWTCWRDLFFSVVDSEIPTIKWKKSKLKHWFSPDTICLIRVKCRLYHRMKKINSDHLKSRYKALSNLVWFRTRQDTTSYVSSLSQLYVTNSKKFWRFINSVKGHRSPIPPIVLFLMILPRQIFSTSIFFSVFTIEDYTDLSSLRSSLQLQPPLIDSITFTADNVFHEHTNLQCDKACGPDSIPTILLQKRAEYISASLSKLFQLSLSSGKLSRDWVTTNVVPVFKRRDAHLPHNYRPISLTSIVIKKWWKNYSLSFNQSFKVSSLN